MEAQAERRGLKIQEKKTRELRAPIKQTQAAPPIHHVIIAFRSLRMMTMKRTRPRRQRIPSSLISLCIVLSSWLLRYGDATMYISSREQQLSLSMTHHQQQQPRRRLELSQGQQQQENESVEECEPTGICEMCTHMERMAEGTECGSTGRHELYKCVTTTNGGECVLGPSSRNGFHQNAYSILMSS